jgi:hypothetical protein
MSPPSLVVINIFFVLKNIFSHISKEIYPEYRKSGNCGNI